MMSGFSTLILTVIVVGVGGFASMALVADFDLGTVALLDLEDLALIVLECDPSSERAVSDGGACGAMPLVKKSDIFIR